MSIITVACAGEYLPNRDVMLGVVSTIHGGHTDVAKVEAPLVGSHLAAQAFAAILGLEFAAWLGYSNVSLMVSGHLQLCARIRTRVQVPELDAVWNTRLGDALRPVAMLRVVSTNRATASVLHLDAMDRCAVLASETVGA